LLKYTGVNVFPSVGVGELNPEVCQSILDTSCTACRHNFRTVQCVVLHWYCQLALWHSKTFI